MHKSKLKQIAIAACIALLMPLTAQAAGLGRLNVISGLGEPLSAEIELLSITPEEMSSLSAAIAPEEAYAAQGIERPSLHNDIKIEPTTRVDGTPILKLTTQQPISDLFLDMLIQVDWPTGRLLREYTALLDPPGYNVSAGSSSPPTVMPSSSPPEPTMVEPGPQEKKASKKAKSAAVMAPEVVSNDTLTDEHETKRGDTLSAIAKRMQTDGISLDQMLVGLYRANKNAFVGENMNRLKVGQIIRAPSTEELGAITRKEASSEVHVQTADWNAYRNKLAGIVAEAPAASEDAGNQSSGGKLTAAAEDKAAPASTGPRDVVKLSKSDSGGANKADAKALQDKLTALQEEGTAREKSVKEANERVVALEKQISDMQKLLAIKNQAMTDVQKNAAAATAVPAAKPVTPTPAPSPAASPAKPATPAPVPPPTNQAAAAPAAQVKPPVETPAAATPSAEVKAPANPEVVADDAGKPAASKPAKTKKKKIVIPPPAPVAPVPAEEPGIVDGLMAGLGDNALLLGGVGGGLVLLGGGWLFFRNKRKRDLDNFEQGILTSGGLKANTVFGNTSGDTVDTGDTSFLTDFSQSPGGMIDTHDVDAIAEAEVYMAYGREAQAEEILKDAIAKEPTRYELHLKLLEIFAARNDTSAFEAVSGELYSTLGASDPVWAKVAEMGHKMEPDNPLYDVSSIPATAGTATPVVAESSQKLDASDFDSAEVMAEPSLDFSLDADPVESTAHGASANQPEESSSLDFDLAASATMLSVEEPMPEFKMPESEPAAAPSMDMSMDMDAPLDFPEKAIEAQSLEDLTLDSKTAESTLQMEAPQFGKTLPGMEMTGLDMPELGAPTVDMPQEISLVTEEAKPADDGGLDFNFDLGTTEEENEVDVSLPETNAAPEIDLSGISLELDAPPSAESAPVNNIAIADSADESEDVNTKLDLVTAYIDMGDKEGARELLDEVLKRVVPNNVSERSKC